MAEKKKILMISLGSIGKRHLRNARALLPDAEIAVYRQHTKGMDDVPEGADVLFDNADAAFAFAPDAVMISSPASEHVKNALPFIAAGIPVFVEKPLADKTDDLDDFVCTVERSSAFVMVGYVLRFLPILHDIRKILQDGTLGDVRTAHVQVGQYLPDWRPDSDYRSGVSAQKSLGGGALLELSHEIDYTTWLFGLPDSLMCSADTLSDLEIDVEDSAHIVFEYRKGLKKNVMLQLDFLQRTAHMGLQIVGSKATLQADLIKEKAVLYAPECPDGKPLDLACAKDGNEIYMRQFDFFFARAFDDYAPKFEETKGFDQYVDAVHAAKVMALVDLAKTSSAQGRRLPFKIEPVCEVAA